MDRTDGESEDRPHASGLRHAVYEALDPEAHDSGLTTANKLLILVILLAAGSAVIETEPTIAQGRLHLFFLAELGFGIVFAIEYLLRLWIVPENPRYQGVRFARLRYAVTPAALVDLISFLPTLLALGFGNNMLVLRFVRVLRILRLAKLGRMSRAWTDLVSAIHERRHELMLTLSIAIVLLLMSSTLMYLVEGGPQPARFGSIPRAMWWAIVTLTTVGYGDVTPVTITGKIISGFVALAGIGLIAMPTGILAAAFSDVVQRRREEAAKLAREEAERAHRDPDVARDEEKVLEERAAKAEHLAETARVAVNPGAPQI